MENTKKIICGTSVFLFAMSPVLKAQNTHKPNIVLIFTDDLGYGDLSCFNQKSKITTKNLDKLTKAGVAFTDAHACSSVSTPSRYGLLTGEYSWKSRLKRGVLGGYSKTLIREGQPTMASMLRSEGYSTACIGKWHLGMDFQIKKDAKNKKYVNGENVDYTKPIKNDPTTHGFDYFYGIAASLDMPPYIMIENDTLVQQPNCKLTVTEFTDFDDAVSKNPFLRTGDAIFGEGPETFLPRLANKVSEKISLYSKTDKPFFIYYAMPSPHAPIAPSKQFQGKSKIGAYGDYVMEVDYYVGEVVKSLKKAGQYKNTIIIFSSDNGPEYYAYKRYLVTGHKSSGELKGIKRDLWEGGHRVPLIVSWPNGFKKYKKEIVNQPVCLTDIYATLADVVDHKITSQEAADSYSLLPLVTKKGSYKRDYVIHHSVEGRFAIRKGDWVYIEYGIGDSNADPDSKSPKDLYYEKRGYTFPKYEPKGELYNLKDDIEERHDVYNEHLDIVKELSEYISKATRGHNTMRDKYINHLSDKRLVY